MRPSLLVALLVLTACAPKRTPVHSAEASPCSVPVAARAGEAWQQVVADGFTFCVPASWRPRGANAFHGEGGWIRWSVGEPGARPTRSVIVAVPAGQAPPAPPGRQHRFSEPIGGGLAELWDNELEGTFYTGAQWRQPTTIYLHGQSTSESARATQIEVYRTVRFALK